MSANAQDKLPDAPIEIPEEAKGKICDVVLKKAEQESTATDISEYVGTVVRFDDKVVVLKNASRQVRIHRGLPILLNAIPYVNRLFKNTAIVSEKIQGEQTIPRSEIRSIKIAK